MFSWFSTWKSKDAEQTDYPRCYICGTLQVCFEIKIKTRMPFDKWLQFKRKWGRFYFCGHHLVDVHEFMVKKKLEQQCPWSDITKTE